MSLMSRFESRQALVEALKAQRIVQGDDEVAQAIADAGELVEFAAGQNLIEEGATDRDMYFLLAGTTQVIVKGVRLYPRERNVTVGEMSAINPEISRAATIQADTPTVACKLSHEALETIAQKQPRIWRLIAVELSSRLEQRNRFINRPNAKPKVFIISSSEAHDIAECIRAGLERESADVVLWSDEIFQAGSYPLEALEGQVNEADFGIGIAHPDDVVHSRGHSAAAPRDNVIFELGYFMSRLGRPRTLLLLPHCDDMKMPSDFKGMTPLCYKPPGPGDNPATVLGPTIYRIKQRLRDLGVRRTMLPDK
jgi:predicted nucleotide-binding protein